MSLACKILAVTPIPIPPNINAPVINDIVNFNLTINSPVDYLLSGLIPRGSAS